MADETQQRSVEIHVPVLTRVEGEGALHLRIRHGRIEQLQLAIFEPPRLFEKFLEGRSYEEVPDLVARICGICPVAYQMSAVDALESLFGITPDPWVQDMRRALYCGEWIESHSLHIHLLAAPDFFGYDNVMAMAKDHPDEVRRGMHLQGLGNALIRLLGARSVHPVGVRVGGFHHAPDQREVDGLLRQLQDALPQAEAVVRWTAAIDMPKRTQSFPSVACAGSDYPLVGGHIVSDRGLSIDKSAFEQHFAEHQEPHSTALHSLLDGHPYLVGPIARLNLHRDRLPEPVSRLIASLPIPWPTANPFHGMVARAIEVYYALHEAIRLLEAYCRPAQPFVRVTPKAGTGFGCSEAPRGLLWHRYDVDDQGLITAARIVPPTSQNQARIEADLRASLTDFGLDQPDDALRQHCEQVIRNYDPCISCATHFLRLTTERL